MYNTATANRSNYNVTKSNSMKTTEKISLWQRFKNYYVENIDMIVPGLLAMNGNFSSYCRYIQYQYRTEK